MPALPISTDQIVITASRAPESEARTPASVSIIDQQRIERLDERNLFDRVKDMFG